MMEPAPEDDPRGWKRFLARHWHMVALSIVGALVASVGSVYVFLWVVGDAQSTGLVPTILGLWTMGNVVALLLHVIFWEVLLIGIPVIVAAIAGWLWWRKLPSEERGQYHFPRARSRSTGGGGAVSALFWIAFLIKVFLDGKWNVAVATWTLDYFVYSAVWTLLWILIIFGIPIAVGVIWWTRHEMSKRP